MNLSKQKILKLVLLERVDENMFWTLVNVDEFNKSISHWSSGSKRPALTHTHIDHQSEPKNFGVSLLIMMLFFQEVL